MGDFEGTTNYTYDAIGNLISDSGEKIEKIEWTLSGKVKRVVFADKPTLEFVYDPLGNRVAKIKKPSAVPTSWEYTYYSKDASGNTMAVYERKTTVANTATPYANDNNTDILRPTEYPLYGSSRLGNYMPQFANQTSAVYTLQADNVRNYNAPYYTNNTKNTHLNERNYELTDHLGNVSATLSDYKTNKQAQILSAHVYYPFGMEMETRSLGKYRYGFNGKEKDDEGLGGGGSTYDYGFRIYNPNLARFLSVDPLVDKYPFLSPYQFAELCPIQFIDLDGLEKAYFDQSTGFLIEVGDHLQHRLPENPVWLHHETIKSNPPKPKIKIESKIEESIGLQAGIKAKVNGVKIEFKVNLLSYVYKTFNNLNLETGLATLNGIKKLSDIFEIRG